VIFSGADLIRNSGRQAERAEKLKDTSTPAVQAPEKKSPIDEETGGALLRFARFIHGEKEKKKKPAKKTSLNSESKRYAKNPYVMLEERLAAESARGQSLDIAI
jgi:hypothetical protein